MSVEEPIRKREPHKGITGSPQESNMRRLRKSMLIRWLSILASVVLLAQTSFVTAAEWRRVHQDRLYSISGIVMLGQNGTSTEFLVVHDNKKDKEPRIGMLHIEKENISYVPLVWLDEKNLPIDLEAVTALPDQPGRFLAIESQGRVYDLRISGTQVTVLGHFDLPDLPKRVNLEGFSVQKLKGNLIAIWGHRGAGDQPGLLFWGMLDLDKQQVAKIGQEEIFVPFPSPSDPNTRHISDLKLDQNGVVWCSAANDPGDAGPFVSAVYTLGTLKMTPAGDIHFDPKKPYQHAGSYPKKIEAIDVLTNSAPHKIFATDDEDDGAWILIQ